MPDDLERDWKRFGYGIIERINAAPSIERLEQLMALHRDNLEAYKGWNATKHAQLMDLVSEKRAELVKGGG